MPLVDLLVFEAGKSISEVENLPIDRLVFWANRFIEYRNK